jgi:hypothetical protein
MQSKITNKPAYRGTTRKQLRSHGTVATRRFGSDGQSEQLIAALTSFAAEHGLPPQIDASAFLRRGLELLRAEVEGAVGNPAAARSVTSAIVRCATGQRAVDGWSLDAAELAERRARYEATTARIDALCEQIERERVQRLTEGRRKARASRNGSN